jgi:hypothetical protein
VYDFVLESRMIRAKMTVSERMRAVLVAHLSLRTREHQKNRGALHGALHPSFDHAAKCSNLACQLPVCTKQGRYRELVCRALVLLLAA